MRLTIRHPLGPAFAGLVLVAAMVAACDPNSTGYDPLTCGFDGDASPGYQGVTLEAGASDAGIQSSHSAPAGSIVEIGAVVRASLRAGSLCNTEITWEVTAGGGTLSSPTSNTGSELSGFNDDYVGLVNWTLGAPGAQTLHGYVSDDPTIEITVTLTATGAVPTNTAYLYNGTDISVYFEGPGENPPAGGLITPTNERGVLIPTTVGSTDFFRAYNSTNTLIASVTCQVTATAWTGGNYPVVTLEFNAELSHYTLTCSEGLVPAV